MTSIAPFEVLEESGRGINITRFLFSEEYARILTYSILAYTAHVDISIMQTTHQR